MATEQDINKVNGDVRDLELEDESAGELITTPFSPSDIKLSTPPMNLGDLIDMLSYEWVNLKTEYQREINLWSSRQQSRLIESVLLGLRLPAFYFEEVSKHHWNIIDGLQRCCAIKNFCVDKTLRLQELEFLNDFEGKKFDDLLFDTVRDIRMLPITVNLLAKGVPDQVKYVLFKRLNTGGISLTNQEIRNAVFMGAAIDAVKEMAKDKAFIDASEGKIPSLRHVDMDFVSRFVAFYWLGYKDYEPDLENYINKSMMALRDKATATEIETMKVDFHHAMKLAKTIFGNRAFRKQQNSNERRKPINKAYFEVISAVLARLPKWKAKKLETNKRLFVDNLQTAMRESMSYRNSFSEGTGSRDAVKRRYQWFEAIVEKSINGKKIVITDDNKIEDSEF